jgi:hypothetical protein
MIPTNFNNMTIFRTMDSTHSAAIPRNRVDIAPHLVVNEAQPIAISLCKNALIEQEPQHQLRDHSKHFLYEIKIFDCGRANFLLQLRSCEFEEKGVALATAGSFALKGQRPLNQRKFPLRSCKFSASVAQLRVLYVLYNRTMHPYLFLEVF